MAEKSLLPVLIYSSVWPISQALVSLCCSNEFNRHLSKGAGVVAVSNTKDILSEINEVKPGILVLDISLRDNCGLISIIRHYYSSLPIVVVQSHFLFSDRVVAEYFGHIWLKEYDALLAGYPTLSLQDHLSHSGFAGTSCGGSSGYHSDPHNGNDPENLLREMTTRLRLRLYDLMKSPRLCEVVMDWLAAGVAPAEVGRSLSRGSKVIYHYRGQVMRTLNIHRGIRDFIPSVTVKFRQDDKGGW